MVSIDTSAKCLVAIVQSPHAFRSMRSKGLCGGYKTSSNELARAEYLGNDIFGRHGIF